MGTDSEKMRAVRAAGANRADCSRALSKTHLTGFIILFALIISEALFFVHGYMLPAFRGAAAFEYTGVWNGVGQVVSLVPSVPLLRGAAGALVMQLCCAAAVFTCLFTCRVLKVRSRLCAAAVCSLVLFFPAMSAGVLSTGLTYSLSLLCASAGVWMLGSRKKIGNVAAAVLMFLCMAFYAPNVSVILSLYLVCAALDSVSRDGDHRRRIGRDAAVFGIAAAAVLCATVLKYRFGDYSGILLFSKLSEMSAFDWFHSVAASYTHFLRFCFGHLYLRGSYLLKAVILVWAVLSAAVFAFVTVPMLKKKSSRKKAVYALVCVAALPLFMSLADFISNDGDRAFQNAFAYVLPFAAGAVLWERLEIRLRPVKKSRRFTHARIACAVCAAAFILACACASGVYSSVSAQIKAYATELRNEGEDEEAAVIIAANAPTYYDDNGRPFVFPAGYRADSVADAARSNTEDIAFFRGSGS